MNNLVYVQCSNPECMALGCRKRKDHLNGSYCKLCSKRMDEITWSSYEHKLHYTKTPHEENLLSNR